MQIVNKPELGQYMTFEFSKEKPIHGWFWYKEGFAPEIVEWSIKEIRKKIELKKILDPFCGVGTTLLAAKNLGIQSIGVDASSLAVFVSKTKTDDYEQSDLEDARAFLEKKLSPDPATRLEFELFDARAAFPKRNYNEILALREGIEQENEKTRNLLLLALLSILPQASLVLKDGGVLKIIKDKKALPAREIFKRRVKKMIRDLETQKTGYGPQIYLGDARGLDLESESIDLVVTSPPYLNNIDYSKIYGLELSLLSMSKAEASEVRMRAIRSFIGKQMEVQNMPPEVGGIGYNPDYLESKSFQGHGEIGNRIPIIGTYFKDMELAIKEMYRVLNEKGEAHITVSNSVIHDTHVIVDEIFAQIAERIGFRETEIVVGAERIADVKPAKVKTRESIVILRK